MVIGKEKILVFDADVIIHFIFGERLSSLKSIYPENKKIILDKVLTELKKNKTTERMINVASETLKIFEQTPFPLNSDIIKEYAHLISPLRNFGPGESACMSYCKFSKDIVVSSNLKDIAQYCKLHNVDYLTTMDLVNWAFENNLWNEEECDDFISLVINKGGRLPFKTIGEFLSNQNN